MKKLCDVLKIAFFAVAIFALVGCPGPNGGTSDPDIPEEKDYSATVSVESISLTTGGETSFTVTSKDGNWVLDENSIPNGIEVTLGEDGITYTVKATGKTAVSGTLTFAEADEKVEDFELIPIEVTSTWVTLNLRFDDALASEIARLSVKYSTSAGSLEAEATIAEDKKTATVLLDSSIYQSDWNGFTLVLTAKDVLDAEIALEYQGWITYEGTVAELTVAKYVEKAVAIAFVFDGFEIPGGSLSVTYGHNQDNEDESDDNFTEVEAEVAEDGKSAIAQFSTNYAKGDYFNGIKAIAKDSEGNEIEGTILSSVWIDYKTTTEITVTKPSEEELSKWTVLKTSDETFTGAYVQFVDASTLAGLSISELKVEVANYAGSGSWWANVSFMSDWSNQIELAKNGE
ncbi:MAG: hypothetical protein E7062_00785, partial [Spirochaetaceae bacterium]|nr:hypothetical protein [Spirochaetaceae bacterium]